LTERSQDLKDLPTEKVQETSYRNDSCDGTHHGAKITGKQPLHAALEAKAI